MESRTRRSFADTRIGRFLTGVAIVWAIAGAFVALEIGLPELLSRAIAAGVVPDRMVLPGGLSSDSAAHCRAGGPSGARPPGTEAGGEARYLAWRLGFQIGWSAGLANMGRSDTGSARSLAEWQASATKLGIPAPIVPPIRHTANALGEFELHVESDPQCTAARLAQAYGRPYGSAFKLGAYVGFATTFRMALPNAPVFVPNIRYHGQGAGAPAELLQPWLGASLDNVPGSGTQEKVAAILDPLDAHFKSR
jgi:hypothetical protein